MKRLLLALMCVINAYAIDPDLPDFVEFTPPISLRSAFSGDIVGFGKDRNWVIRDIPLTEDMLRNDPFKDFHLGVVQFVQVGTKDMCLAIAESGLFTRKSCNDDLKSKRYETLIQSFPPPHQQCKSALLY